MSNAGDEMIGELREAMKGFFASVADAAEDERCGDAAEWILRAILRPGKPGSVGVPDPTGPGGEVVAILCDRFNVKRR